MVHCSMFHVCDYQKYIVTILLLTNLCIVMTLGKAMICIFIRAYIKKSTGQRTVQHRLLEAFCGILYHQFLINNILSKTQTVPTRVFNTTSNGLFLEYCKAVLKLQRWSYQVAKEAWSINQSIKKIHSGLNGNRQCKDHWKVIIGKVQGKRNKTREV